MADIRTVRLQYSVTHDMEGSIDVDFDEVRQWAHTKGEPTPEEVQEWLELGSWDNDLKKTDLVQADGFTIHEVTL